MMKKSPKLPITNEERSKLRSAKIKLNEVVYIKEETLSKQMNCSLERAKWIRALAEFQTVPSIGPKLAEVVVSMGFYSLDECKNEDGAAMTDQLEKQNGYWVDPCVEDCLRCIVYHANHPESEKSWYDFTPERKAYRTKYGYPATRPTMSWQEHSFRS